jgi:hypothetical protein
MGGAPSEPKELQYRYWLAFDEYLEEHGFHLTHANPRPRAYMEFSIGKAGFQLTATASYRDSETGSYGTGELRAEFLIRGLNAKLYFETLQQHKEEIESELGEPLQWYNPEEALRCIIYLRKPADIRDEARWPEQHAWLMQKIQALHHVFAPRIRQLASD